MAAEGFGEFFLASAGTGGAFVGLLFVAIAVGPGRTFGDPAGVGAPRQHLLRVAGLSLVAAVVHAIEALVGLRLILTPEDEAAFGWLAAAVVGLYALGIARAWTLPGDPRPGWSGWLNPLQDLEAPSESDIPPDTSP